MKRIYMLDPSVGSMNRGDDVIVEGVVSGLNRVFHNPFYLYLPVHTPVTKKSLQYFEKPDYTFVCGSNLLKADMLFGFRQWVIDLSYASVINDAILIGCGWWQYQNKIDLYSKILYKKVLSHNYYHSVRDSYTEKKMREMGFENVITTGCPSMWGFTEEFCNCIPTIKADNVITTITDYKRDIKSDCYMLDTLLKNYNSVYLWLQGYEDYKYLAELGYSDKVITVGPTLKDYDIALDMDNIEYVGTRLHAGIRAIQHKKRSLIISVDNRAIEKKKDFKLNVLERKNVEDLNNIISNDIITAITIDTAAINKFLNQFSSDN